MDVVLTLGRAYTGFGDEKKNWKRAKKGNLEVVRF